MKMAGVFCGDFIYNDFLYFYLSFSFAKIEANTERQDRVYESYHNKAVSITDG